MPWWNSGHVFGYIPQYMSIPEIPTFVSSSPIPKITIPNTTRNGLYKSSKLDEHGRLILWFYHISYIQMNGPPVIPGAQVVALSLFSRLALEPKFKRQLGDFRVISPVMAIK